MAHEVCRQASRIEVFGKTIDQTLLANEGSIDFANCQANREDCQHFKKKNDILTLAELPCYIT